MDIATIAAKYLKKTGKLTKLDESEEINACTVKMKVDVDGKEEDWLLLFKNETHNHPTGDRAVRAAPQRVSAGRSETRFREELTYTAQ